MGDVRTKSYKCSTCGAPLALKDARDELLRCRYCGSDHRVVCPKAEASAELRAERRVGAIAAPFVIGPILGFAGFFAYRDFLWSPYEGTPAMVVAALFVLIGLMAFRMPAALGLALVGLAGVLKPFLRPIPSYYNGEVTYLSSLSESSFYYLVPGAIAAAIGFGFFASLKVKDLGAASRALIPRASMVLATIVGVVGGYFFLGQTGVGLVHQNKAVVAELTDLATAACTEAVPAGLQGPLSPSPKFARPDLGNVLMVSCERMADPHTSRLDPYGVDGLAWFYLEGQSRAPRMHAGSTSWQERRYDRAKNVAYVIAYRGPPQDRRAIVVDRKTRTSLIVADKDLRTDSLFYSALVAETGGTFPKGRDVASKTLAEMPSKAAPPAPISATYEHHSAAVNQIETLWVYGFVTNTSSIPIGKSEVLVVLKDAEGRELRSEHAYAAYPTNPGEKSPIAIIVTKPPAYSSIEFETIPKRQFGLTSAKGLAVSEDNSSTTSGTLNIAGKVRNDGAKPAKFVQVHAMLFDADDKLVGLKHSYVKAETLEPGADARFLDKMYGFDEATMKVEYHVTGAEGRR